jgi:PTH2 family peptidyl-tRNA hydrolase
MPIEPNPFDDERLAKIRAEQGDPLIQYYIVRTDLNMSAGKMGAQIAHGAQMFVIRSGTLAERHKNDMTPLKPEYEEILGVVAEWMNGSFRKVVLGGKKKDFEKIIAELRVFLVRDAGLTEVEPNSETVLVTWPIRRSECPKILKRLQTLK